VWLLADLFFAKSPEQMGLRPDGDAPETAADASPAAVTPPSLPARLRSNRKFLTLAAGMSLGLFAQIGLLAHLYSLLVPALGRQNAGLAVGGATAAAIAGRTLVSRLIARRRDRRLFACASYVVQIAGAMALLMAAGTSVPLLLAGVVLFGAGIGNATSLPPLIAQTEFAKEDVARVVPMILAVAQACYAFAPATFGLIRALQPGAGADGVAPQVFIAGALIKCGAILALWLGRFEPRRRPALAGEPAGR
jgi:cyanate permease